MYIENRTSNPTFGRAYINMQSLNHYGNGKKHIIDSLKEKNTPLREFIKNVVNTKEFENDMGDCFISFNRQRHFGEGEYLFDTIKFSFPQKQNDARKHMIDFFENGNWGKIKKEKFEPYKESIVNQVVNETTYYAGFSDNEIQDGAKELEKYIKGNEIVEDLKRHLEKLKTHSVYNV